MAKEKAKQPDKAAGEYYQLHTGAVDDLVNTTAENAPRYSQAELDKYRSGKKKWKLPESVKALLIKFWFYGAVCFFVFMGLGVYVTNQWDMLFIGAVVLGMVTDLLINHFLRFTEKMPGGSRDWMLVTRRGAMGFFMNLMYGFLLMAAVITLYNLVNMMLISVFGAKQMLGVEPILFGIFATGADMLFIAVKRTFRKIVEDAKNK
ncbi:MAG: hypothetical protein IJB69_04880 [Clostridia bacterium]|nr:hypothetical protein [Clostridia bacterium]